MYGSIVVVTIGGTDGGGGGTGGGDDEVVNRVESGVVALIVLCRVCG